MNQYIVDIAELSCIYVWMKVNHDDLVDMDM